MYQQGNTPYLSNKSRYIHGVGCETHAKDHGGLDAQKPRHQLLQVLVSVQVTYTDNNHEVMTNKLAQRLR